MSTTQHTGHYNLPTFGDNPNDRPSWRGDFTDAMTKIDNQMYANATNITTATAAANNAKVAADAAKESADTAAELAQANETGIAKLDGYFNALGVTSAGTAQNLLNTINGKADANDVASINATATTAKNDAGAAKSTATTAITKANSNTAILNALGAGDTVDASAKQAKWDNAANKANELVLRVQALEQEGTQVRRDIVLLGDSWTVGHNNALYNRLKADMPHATWHHYSIDGAVLQRLPEMVNNAKQDTGLHADQVTDVIIVMGTNNVFWTNLDDYPDITEDSACAAFRSVRDYFTNANIIFVPNNSKTLNNGRNNLYAKMVDGAHRAGVTTHEESLILLCGHREWFNGDTQEGVQHLSDTGYKEFADRIANLLQGGAMLQGGRVGPVGGQSFNYTNPSDKSGIDDNTLQIYVLSGGLLPVGWLQNPKATFVYHADQTVTIEISGMVKFWDTTKTGPCYIGCPNWYKNIASNTLPYVFTHAETDLYYQPRSLTGLSDDYMFKIESREGGTFCTKSFYFWVDTLFATHANKNMRLLVPNVQTEVMGVSR